VEPELDNLKGRITTIEHALFGVGKGASGGMVSEIRGLRQEFHEFREDVAKLYKMVVVATFALTGTIIGGVIVPLLSHAS
jgi:hypothetical protein